MKKISRRTLVKVGAGLVAFWPAAQALAARQPSNRQESEQNPRDYFVAGFITGVKGNDLLFADEQNVVTRVTIHAATAFWRGGYGDFVSQVKVGDFLFARGVVNGAHLTARVVWVNIVNLTGEISHVGAGHVLLKTKTQEVEVIVRPEAEVFLNGQQQARASMRANSALQLVGLWDEQARRVTATRLFLPDEQRTPHAQVEEQVILQATPELRKVYHGCASWFCCGNPYGPCGQAGGGACGDCQSSSYHCAWAHLNHYGYICNVNACGIGNQLLKCGSNMHVTNPCNGSTLKVSVHDCGPDEGQFCGNRAPDCSPSQYFNRVVDLTPASFSALAPLSQGLTSVKCY